MTWSPVFSDVTPAPISITMPAPSCPRIAGNKPSGSAPESVYASVWQIPVAFISTRTSPARGPSRSTVATSSGSPALFAIAAFTLTRNSRLGAHQNRAIRNGGVSILVQNLKMDKFRTFEWFAQERADADVRRHHHHRVETTGD